MSTRLAGRFFACMQMILGRTCERVFGSVRFLFERYQASWISQQKVVESASLLKFRGFPIMRTITATTAFKMPLYGISFPLSAFQESSTVFRNFEKLSCANEVGASKPLFINKGLLLTDRSLSGHQLHSFSDFQGVDFLCLENCINPILQPRSPAMDYRGCLLF